VRRHPGNIAAKAAFIGFLLSGASAQEVRVGPTADGGHVVTTAQLIHPAGTSVEFNGRPVDLAFSPDGKLLAVKDNRGVVFIDPLTMTITQELDIGDHGGSMTGIAFTPDGAKLLVTDSHSSIIVVTRTADGAAWACTGKIAIPGPKAKAASYPCGIAVNALGTRAFVAASRNNTLAIIDLSESKLISEVPVGIAPFAVCLSADERMAFVSNWGGRKAKFGEATADSSGTPALINAWGGAASGTVSFVNLAEAAQTAEVETGLSASGLCLSHDRKTLYVANANSDTVSFVDVASAKVTSQLNTRPARPEWTTPLPFGSMPNGLALSSDGSHLFVSNAGNNAVASVKLEHEGASPGIIEGLIPTGWYPGAVVARGSQLFVANIKGIGSRTTDPKRTGFNSHRHRGTVQRVELPDAAGLSAMTAVSLADAQTPRILAAIDRTAAGSAAPAVPIPAHAGERSVIEHIVYIIRENRTFDQVMGDMPNCNADASLCVYGKSVTPNAHALASQFVLLDNFYCNGVLSADGHSWATEGNVTPYLERSFGGFNRSYTYGNDPLTYSSSGFIWDHVLAAGRTFRNYGEFDTASTEPHRGYKEVYEDWVNRGAADYKAGTYKFIHSINTEHVKNYTCTEYPGWDMEIPDQVRADVFIAEFDAMQHGTGKDGAAASPALATMPDLTLLYLPNDHTSGRSEGKPTPRSLVADNDLALGRIVERLSHSKFWPTMCIFVVEDDPQDGWDHVDGHRSPCLVISPFTKHGVTVSDFYCQGSVVHSIERIMGIAAANQVYAATPLMTACFTTMPDFKTFTHVSPEVPLCELYVNPKRNAAADKAEVEWDLASASLPLGQPDLCDENTLNRILWHAAKGDEPYPTELAGAHGKGLAALGLTLGGEVDDDD